MKYSKSGLFILLMVAFSTLTSATQLINTQLRITVLNELGNKEEGAEVTLYATEEDYRKETNPVLSTQKTDRKGRVTFKGLEEKVYFVMVKKGEMNNNGLGVQTEKLVGKKINKITIIIG